ncbi:MAG: S1 RNA-binding domain-containing protein [Desulfamplus sp.]|nr:S1 RNA-binding domain-containing protein [Desulfamplus sp.]
MADMFSEDGENIESEESFADLLDSYDAGDNNDIRQGDKINGTIISIGQSSVYVSTGSKSDGVVEKAELLDESGQMPYKVGDTLTLYVVSMNESEIILSRALSGAGYAALLEEAAENGTPVEGKVSAIIKGGFSVDIMGKRAFCPISQIDVKYVENQEDYLGKTLSFLITSFAGGKNIVVSRRELMNREIQDSKDEYFKKIAEGDIVQGKVVKIMPYGAFIELTPGVEGMAHISELSWSRVDKTDDLLVQDELVSVKILKIEHQKGQNSDPKISLSIRQTTQDPWERAEQSFTIGQQLTGKVVRLAPFGAFVEIAPGVDGLVHISEMSRTKRVVKAGDMVEQGQMVEVIVKDIDLKNKRISLSMKDAHADNFSDSDSDVVDKNAPSNSKKDDGADWKKFAENQNTTKGIGSMGELLMRAMDKK